MARTFNTLVILLVSFLSATAGWDIGNENDRCGCQAYSANPLDGCDQTRTIYVDKTPGKAHFTTVQAAVASIPNNTDTYIVLIASGNYTEQWSAIATTGIDNAYTSTLTIAPNLNASLTGSGTTGFAVPADTPFGSTDFRTYNLNFINNFAPYSDDPSLALSISRANGGFYYTGFYSFQDTIYVGKLGNAYFKNGVVAGETDFFYGFGTAWVESTNIELRNCGGGITAWKGTNTTFLNHYGVYVVSSSVRAVNASIAPIIVGKCALGRPWNSQMRSIFSYTYLDASIKSTGFVDWSPSRFNNYTVQAEYHDYGPGYNATGRNLSAFDVQLTWEEYEPYSTPAKVFQYPDGEFGNTGWIDWGI